MDQLSFYLENKTKWGSLKWNFKMLVIDLQLMHVDKGTMMPLCQLSVFLIQNTEINNLLMIVQRLWNRNENGKVSTAQHNPKHYRGAFVWFWDNSLNKKDNIWCIILFAAIPCGCIYLTLILQIPGGALASFLCDG